ncbi:tyrosine--tRNA ligase, mitochondrial [Patella vulgata]|uniref:tyrosine--tRNA ligase, mitochondrial n=1 Tax=Patella vulgata TaxID=6465 RepID=UPI002180319F|nr:tyrosine--tRNA ligase, mitochondrial [Patella vulgata]
MSASMKSQLKLLTLTKNSINRCKTFLRRNSNSLTPPNLLDLQGRGIFQHIYPEKSLNELSKRLSAPQCIYCGFDPTADSLHIGNLLAIIALIHGQRYGHNVIALVGGATAQVGDPSGKTKDRIPLDIHDVERNVEKIGENLQRIFNNHKTLLWENTHKSLHNVRIENNIHWYKDKNVVDFLSIVGRKFRMGPMLSKHSVQSRLSSEEGMSFTEFTYQIFQSFDWFQLYQKYNCRIQIGGTDQLGNILAGHDFIEKQIDDRVFGLTVPLVTTTAGNKLGKTAGNAVWLDPLKTSQYELYQYFLNVSDDEVEKYLKLFTFLSDDDIMNILKIQENTPDQRPAQKKLAEQVTLLVHGATGLQMAKIWTEALFQNSVEKLSQLSEDELKYAPVSLVTELPLQDDMTVKDMCMKIKCFRVEADAVRIIKNGGVYINHRRVTESSLLKHGTDILPNKLTLIRIGKKNFYIVKWI